MGLVEGELTIDMGNKSKNNIEAETFLILTGIQLNIFSDIIINIFINILREWGYAIAFFFNCYLAAPRPTLGHCRGGSLTHPILITVF